MTPRLSKREGKAALDSQLNLVPVFRGSKGIAVGTLGG
jgi:hypothetical protein